MTIKPFPKVSCSNTFSVYVYAEDGGKHVVSTCAALKEYVLGVGAVMWCGHLEHKCLSFSPIF